MGHLANRELEVKEVFLRDHSQQGCRLEGYPATKQPEPFWLKAFMISWFTEWDFL